MKHKQVHFLNIRGDIYGGITAGIVALPLALAFGVQSGLGAAAGLYGAIALGLMAALFGGSPMQISGPTGPMTILTAAMIASFYQLSGSASSIYGLIILTFLLAGIFQLAFGFIGLGKYIRYVPYPVVSGFMSGIGVILILLQIFPLTGQPSPGKVLEIISNLGELAGSINQQALILGIATIVLAYIFPLITKIIPGSLAALILLTIISSIAGLDVPTIGDIPQGLPALQIGSIFNIDPALISKTIIPALALAGLGAIDTLLTSVVADNLTNTKHKSNKELIGQGIGNVLGSFFGGVPGSGATMRTVINIRNGGRSGLSGAIHAVLLFVILLGAGRYISQIPMCVLAGILITVGIGIIDKKGIYDLVYMPRADAVVLVIVLLLTIFLDLLQAVGAGMVIASVLFMKRASDLVDSGTELTQMTKFDKEVKWDDEDDITEEMLNEIYIQRLDGPVFFGSVTKFQELMSAIPEHARVVIIRMRRVPYMDMSGLYAMESAINNLKEKGIIVLFTIIQPQPFYMLRKINIVPGLVPENNCFKTFEEAANWLRQEYFKR